MRNKQLYLQAVQEDEALVQDIINQALTSFDKNVTGPKSYLSIYDPYLDIINGTEERDMLKFMAIEPPPYLKVKT